MAEDIEMMLLSSLTRIRNRQEEAHQDGSAPKKARTIEPADGAELSLESAVSPALTPFRTGGK